MLLLWMIIVVIVKGCDAKIPSEWSSWVKIKEDNCTGSCTLRLAHYSRKCLIYENGTANCTGNSTRSLLEVCSIGEGCLVDGEWGVWTLAGVVGPCNALCGMGTRLKISRRACNNPPPVGAGKGCEGSGVKSEFIICQKNISCAGVDGGWGSWRIARRKRCSVTCGVGIATVVTARRCDRPFPLYSGKGCRGRRISRYTELCGKNVSCREASVFGGMAIGYACFLNICAIIYLKRRRDRRSKSVDVTDLTFEKKATSSERNNREIMFYDNAAFEGDDIDQRWY